MTVSYLAVCPRLPGNDLAAAECEALTGGKPAEDGIAVCASIAAVPRAAYIQRGARLMAQADTLDELVSAIAGQQFPADDFRIEHLRLAKDRPLSWPAAVVALANAIHAMPNLEQPRHRFILLTRQNGLMFAEIETEADRSYEKHRHKPYHLSSSLPAQIARALVNLLPPTASTILDPCCGTGSVLLEVQALGLQAFGSDWNPRMVGMARKNLAHFGYPSEVKRLDARQQRQTVDAIVTDLPYGRFTSMKEDNLRGILQHCAELAPVAVYVAGWDISQWLFQAGYASIEVLRVPKRKDFSRYVHRAHR